MAPLHEAAVAALGPLARRSLLDAGCGTGHALRCAATAGARVSGLDAAAPMLDVVRERPRCTIEHKPKQRTGSDLTDQHFVRK